jgi:tight adherence protein B
MFAAWSEHHDCRRGGIDGGPGARPRATAGGPVIGVLAAALAAYGVFLVWSARCLGWTGFGFGPRQPRRRRTPLAEHLERAGLSGVRPSQLAGTSAAVSLLAGSLGFILFGGLIPAAICAAFATGFPVASVRARRSTRTAEAREAWPRMLEELRLLTGSLGRSLPQALFEVGRRAPGEMRPAFRRAEREWLLTTDFPRTLDLLKSSLADATVDAICETLLVANDVGGGGLDRRLSALIEDRIEDVGARKDAIAKQAGVKFARRFVLVVPLGMALAGLSIGNGRSSYQSPTGQLAVVVGLASIAACWAWSGRLLRLPAEPRVFAEASTAPVARPSDNRAPQRTGGQMVRPTVASETTGSTLGTSDVRSNW